MQDKEKDKGWRIYEQAKTLQSIKYISSFNTTTICMWGQMAAAKTTTSNKQVDTQKFNAAVKNDKKKLKTDH